MMSIYEFLILAGFILIVNQILDLRDKYTHLCMRGKVECLDFTVLLLNKILLNTLYLISSSKQVLTKKFLDIWVDYIHNTDSEWSSLLFFFNWYQSYCRKNKEI